MRIALFYHSLVSDWNHGNAHFLRGVASELQHRGHQVRIFEPGDSWSRENLLREAGAEAIEAFHRAFPTLSSTRYSLDDLQMQEWLGDIDLAIVHEWTNPRVISAAGEQRRRNPQLRLLFHDTHHRALTATEELARFELQEYDGVLAYGASLKFTYERRGWGRQVFVWHEAADVRTFYPRQREGAPDDVVWIGNWGDEERSTELREYFIEPVKNLRFHAHVFGVRYPEPALRELAASGIAFGGGCRISRFPKFLRNSARRCMCRAGHTRENCQAFQPYGLLRRSLAAFPWSPRPGRIARISFASIAISSWPATEARCSAICATCKTTQRSPGAWPLMELRPFAHATPARIGWMSYSMFTAA